MLLCFLGIHSTVSGIVPNGNHDGFDCQGTEFEGDKDLVGRGNAVLKAVVPQPPRSCVIPTELKR